MEESVMGAIKRLVNFFFGPDDEGDDDPVLEDESAYNSSFDVVPGNYTALPGDDDGENVIFE